MPLLRSTPLLLRGRLSSGKRARGYSSALSFFRKFATPEVVASLRVHVARRGSGHGPLRVEISRKEQPLSLACHSLVNAPRMSGRLDHQDCEGSLKTLKLRSLLLTNLPCEFSFWPGLPSQLC